MKIPDKQLALIQLALTQVGVYELGENSGPIVEMYQSVIGKPEKEPWCVSFVQWCVREVDRKFSSQTVLFPTESSQILWKKTPQIARITTPEPGCIVIWTKFKNELPLSIGHVGIVKEIIDSNYMITIEGNTSPGDGIQREGDGVYLKRRLIRSTNGYMRLTGFIMPWAA